MIDNVKAYKPLFLGVFMITALGTNAQEKTLKIEADPLIQELVILKNKMVETKEINDRYIIQLSADATLGEAEKTRAKLQKEFPEMTSTIEYQAPNYKVWAGNFRNRIEADRAFKDLKETFKKAFVFKPRS